MTKKLTVLSVFLFVTIQVFAQEDKIYKSSEVDSLAQLKMTLEDFSKLINEKLVYPELGKRLKIDGLVQASLVIEADGTLSDVKIWRGIGGGYDEETVRFIKANLTDWKSATVDGRSVRQELLFPIRYDLEKGWTDEQMEEDFMKIIYSNIFPKRTEKLPKEELDYINAKPKGGLSALHRYIENEIRYPREARRNKIQGVVYLEFIVEKDGGLTDIKVVKGILYGCDEEAVRIMKNAPKWIPGKTKEGVLVRQRFSFPIIFKRK
jgi:TonB family protein